MKSTNGKKASIKVGGDGFDSESTSDYLSYSYSCVKAFHKNQNIIGHLAALHNDPEYQGTGHQPELYSLSGERNRPYGSLSYCKVKSENSTSSSSEDELDYSYNYEKQTLEPVNKQLTDNETQPQFPIKALLLQWIKYQFKQVNSLWSSTLPNIFISRIFKRTKKMKMEMTLNGVDEESKQRLIEYINKSNLSCEEYCNLCTGNETVLEIDVTSIIDDPQRLQHFLSFLKRLESEKSKMLNTESPKSRKFSGVFGSKKSLEKNNEGREIKKKEILDFKMKDHRKSLFKKSFHQNSDLSLSSQSNESFVKKNKTVTFERNEMKRVDERQTYNTLKSKVVINDQGKSNQITLNQGKKKTRHISTISDPNTKPNVAITDFEKNKFIDQRNTCLEPNIYSVHKNTSINKTTHNVEKESSCKCLMHKNREDYYRYNHQCLFGKGDEINNSFVKYVKGKEYPTLIDLKNNKTKVLPCERVLKYSTVELNDKIDETACLQQNMQGEPHINIARRKINHAMDQKYDSEENVYSISSSVDNSFQNECCSSNTNSNTNRFEEDLKAVATNACFKSISYCLESFPNVDNTAKRCAMENNKFPRVTKCNINKICSNESLKSNLQYCGGTNVQHLCTNVIKHVDNDNKFSNRQILQQNIPPFHENIQKENFIELKKYKTENTDNAYNQPRDSNGQRQYLLTQKICGEKGAVNVNIVGREKCYCLDSFPDFYNIVTGNVRENNKSSGVTKFKMHEETVRNGNECYKSLDSNIQNLKQPKSSPIDLINNLNGGNFKKLHDQNSQSNENAQENFIKLENCKTMTLKSDTQQEQSNCQRKFAFSRKTCENKDEDGMKRSRDNLCEKIKPCHCYSDKKIFKDKPSSNAFNDKGYLNENSKKCCIDGCDCKKSTKPKSSVKTIVFRIGSSKTAYKLSSGPIRKKISSNFKSLNVYKIGKKSSEFRENYSMRKGDWVDFIWKNERDIEKTPCHSTVEGESTRNKSDLNDISNSLISDDVNTSFIDSFPRSKGTLQTSTQHSATQDWSTITADTIDTLFSEVKSQRLEINYLKKLLRNAIT